MKLLRYGPAGKEKSGIVDADGAIRSLEAHVSDWNGATINDASLAKIAKLKLEKLPLVPAGTRIGPCVARPGKFVAIGLNYSDHAAETGHAIPKEPVVFNKWTSCIVGPNDDIVLPPRSKKTDWEVELGVVIGKTARAVTQREALTCVAGYCVVNDVSEREWQMEHGMTWDKGKGFDTFGPIGPWLVTRDEIPNPQRLSMWLDLNGKRMQTGTTRTMIFDVRSLLVYCSTIMTLEPGDIITTGTPPGVGFAMKPPVFLRDNDVVTLGIQGLGEQRQTVRKTPLAPQKSKQAIA